MTPAFSPDLQETISKTGIIAVLVIDDATDAVPLARALLEGGVNVMELTLRTAAAMDALRVVRAEVPEMIAGVGTVLTTTQVAEIKEAGAQFGVSPGCNPNVLKAARDAGLPFGPGITTPTDIEVALENGCQLLKFFPAEPMGGLKYLRSAAAPYAHLGLKYVPLGGVNENNLAEYSSEPLVAAVGGSWLAPKPKIAAKDWSGIRDTAKTAREIIDQGRSTNG